jgi:hypothetical protein
VLIPFFCLAFFKADAQCAGTFEIKSIQNATEGKADGKIVVSIHYTGSYTCELVSYKNVERITKSQKSGSGSGTVVFQDLDKSTLYRISITFSDESDPLCKTRVLDRISVSGDKQKL